MNKERYPMPEAELEVRMIEIHKILIDNGIDVEQLIQPVGQNIEPISTKEPKGVRIIRREFWGGILDAVYLSRLTMPTSGRPVFETAYEESGCGGDYTNPRWSTVPAGREIEVAGKALEVLKYRFAPAEPLISSGQSFDY